MSDFLLSSLTRVRKKVRRLTRNPSESQLTTTELDKYVNSFVLYDLPTHLRSDILKTKFTFFTKPNVGEYESVIGITHMTDKFYHFSDIYPVIDSPVYIAGNLGALTLSETEFYNIYPKAERREIVGTGDGATTTFTGTSDSVPILKKSVSLTSTYNGDRLYAKDAAGSGTLTGDVSGGANTISYSTGAFTVKFNKAPDNGETVYLHYTHYVAGKPELLLFTGKKLHIRPVPDDAYRIELTVQKRPIEMSLLGAVGASWQMPELSEWWEYIALGASIKILHDRLDFETASLLEPEFKRQEIVSNRRKIVQNSSKRAATIFAPTFKKGNN